MNELIENTYNAYEAFLEGELNQYDIMSLIEDEIISNDLLESMLEEGFISNTINKLKNKYEYGKSYTKNFINSAALVGTAGKVHQKLQKMQPLNNMNSFTKKDLNDRLSARKDVAALLKRAKMAKQVNTVKNANYKNVLGNRSIDLYMKYVDNLNKGKIT